MNIKKINLKIIYFFKSPGLTYPIGNFIASCIPNFVAYLRTLAEQVMVIAASACFANHRTFSLLESSTYVAHMVYCSSFVTMDQSVLLKDMVFSLQAHTLYAVYKLLSLERAAHH